MKYKSGRERSIAVAANFPNFVNKLPGTKILKRIVKVLNLLPLRFIPLFFPPFADCEFICFLSQRKQFSTPQLVSLLVVLLSPFGLPRISSKQQGDTLLDNTFPKGKLYRKTENTRKNRYKYEKYLYVPVLGEQSFTSRKSFSRSTTTTTCKRVLETRKKHDGQFSPRRRLGSTLPSPPLFLPSHKNRKDQRIKGEAKLR